MRYRYDSRGRARGYTGRPGQQRWRYTSRLAKAGYIACSFVTVLVVVASLGAYAVYRHLTGNISAVKVTGLSHRSVYGAQNILLLGSQTRKGQGKGFGSNPSLNTSNSDNLLLVHLDPRIPTRSSCPSRGTPSSMSVAARRGRPSALASGALPGRDHRRGDEHRWPLVCRQDRR